MASLAFQPLMKAVPAPASGVKGVLAGESLASRGAFVKPLASQQRTSATVRAAAGVEPTRRSALLSLAASAALLAVGPVTLPALPALANSSVNWEAVRGDIDNLITADKDKGPTIVRLAWHSSGSYDRMTRTGGSGGGTIRFKEELAHGGNAGLDKAVTWLEPIHTKYRKQGLSYADLYTLAGVQAIKTMGGPDIPWRAGRVDALDPSAVTPDGRLPNADSGPPGADESDAAHLRKVFGRMGFNDQEIVALSGAHALGRCHAEASGYIGPWTGSPTSFNNSFFFLLQRAQWEYDPSKPKYQYKDASGTLMMLPTDIVLVKDPEFAKWVKVYAKDNKKFFEDFSAAFSKLLELGIPSNQLYSVA
eukprot:jgi/Mesvir1/20846/Mv07937-RA.1